MGLSIRRHSGTYRLMLLFYGDCPLRPNPKWRTILVGYRRAYIRYDGSYLFSRKARSLLYPRLIIRPATKGVQVSAMHPLQTWLHPPAICKISKTNMLINQLKTCDTLSHPRVAFVEQLWLQITHFKKCMYMRDVFCDGI
jgi:hypothetical protein